MTVDKTEIRKLQELARRIRIHAVKMTSLGKSAHVGAILSSADILAVLYGLVLRVKPENPTWQCRDRFILSKGHAGAGVYAILAEMGFFPVEKLSSHYQDGSELCGHVSHKGIPGVELSTGSLGHGLSLGAGMALAAKLDRHNHRVFVLMSDGECDEGSNWEAILFAAHHHLENLIAIIDYNKIQSLASVSDTINLEPFAEKWISFGWAVSECDGHSIEALSKYLSEVPIIRHRPSCIICHTIKGKGVPFMENQVLWHYRSPQGEELEAALNALGDAD